MEEKKICPFNMRPCMKADCVFFDAPSDVCELKGTGDLLFDILKKLEELEEELT